MEITYKTKPKLGISYDNATDKVHVRVGILPDAKVTSYDRAEFVRIAKAIENEALAARHAPALTGVPE